MINLYFQAFHELQFLHNFYFLPRDLYLGSVEPKQEISVLVLNNYNTRSSLVCMNSPNPLNTGLRDTKEFCGNKYYAPHWVAVLWLCLSRVTPKVLELFFTNLCSWV